MRSVNPSGKHGPKRRHHGQGSVIERRDHWRAEPWLWTLRGPDRSGKRIVLASCSASSKDAVEAKAKRLLTELARGASRDALGLSVADMLDRWLASTRDTVRPGSFVAYRGTVRRLKPAFADVPLLRLDAETTRGKLTGTAHQRRRGLLVLRMALRQAVDERLLPADPTRGVRPPRIVAREAPTIDAATARKLIERTAKDELGPLVVLALATGLRRGELLALRWQDITGDAIAVCYSLRPIPREFRAEREPSVRPVEPKTARSTRLVPLPAIAVAALEVQKTRQEGKRKAAKVWAENDLVFADDHGQALWPGSVTRRVEQLLRPVVPGIRLHDLRRVYATLLGSIAPVRVQMGLMGHTTPRQSLAYQSLLPDEARQASETLGEMLRREG